MAGRIVEFFGYSPLDPAASKFVAERRCPFVNGACIKPSLGACSLQQTNSEPIVICPNRLYANNHGILADIAMTAFGADVVLSLAADIKTAKKAKSLTGNEVAVFGKYWGSELSIPQPKNADEDTSDGFYIDYVLARLELDVFRLSCSFLLPLREKVARLGRMRGSAKRMMQSANCEI